MLIAQLTDTHIVPEGRFAYGVVDTAGFLARAVSHVEALAPDVVLVTGDLTDSGAAEELGRFRALTRPIEHILLPIPGNHDQADTFRAAFPAIAARCDGGDLSYSVDDHALRLVMLDTTVAGMSHGEMTPERLDWLDATLARQPGRPTLIAMHHPPFETGIAHMDRQNCRNATGLANVIGRHRQVAAIVCGHVHRAVTALFAGVPATIGPAPAHAVSLALDPAAPATFHMEPPALHVHLWDGAAGGRFVTHVSQIGDYPGPYPFFGADTAIGAR